MIKYCNNTRKYPFIDTILLVFVFSLLLYNVTNNKHHNQFGQGHIINVDCTKRYSTDF